MRRARPTARAARRGPSTTASEPAARAGPDRGDSAQAARGPRIAPLLAALALGCQGSSRPRATEAHAQADADERAPGRAAAGATTVGRADDAPEPPRSADPHQLTYADRSSMGYLLLVGPESALPTRAELRALAQARYALELDKPEVRELLRLIDLAPADPGALAPDAPPTVDPDPRIDALIALHVEELALADVVDPRVFDDPILTRALEPSERGRAAQARRAWLLRADYRNLHGFRGLRLLQSLVSLVAEHYGALIFDPDTQELVGPARFSERRLRVGLGNVAEQLAIVPFSDPARPGHVRLTTRGMRRFGCVDLELAGLAPDPMLLQRATWVLGGLAYALVREAELDVSGFSYELDERIELTWDDVKTAWGGAALPRCTDCREHATVHLVRRPGEPHDPFDHPVAQLVAPRSRSDRPEYPDEHPAWALALVDELVGTPR